MNIQKILPIHLANIEIVKPSTILNSYEKIIVNLKIKNCSQVKFRKVKIKVDLPHMMVTKDTELKQVAIEVNEEVIIQYEMYALCGGRDFLRFYININELFDLEYVEYNTILSVKGQGYYRGDNHSHSTRSDGQNNNSVKDNCLRVYDTRAISWLTPTDHSFINKEDYQEVNNQFDDFVCMPNSAEYGIVGHSFPKGVYPNGKLGEHALQYNISHLDNNVSTGRTWQDIIDEVNTQNGVFYIAHPYYPSIWWEEENIRNAKNINGIEVWQGDYHALDEVNRKAFIIWDEVNRKGKKVMGLANSDGHFLHRLGHPFIMAKLDYLNIENIFDVLRSGHYYGSNGPYINFRINDKSNGETFFIEDNQKIKADLFCYTKGYIEKIIIIKNRIGNNHAEVIFEKNNLGTNYYENELILDVEIGDFYRVEIITSNAEIGPGCFLGNFHGKGFAYTNPIWIEKGIEEEFNSLSYSNNLIMKKNKLGLPYFISKSFEKIQINGKTINIEKQDMIINCSNNNYLVLVDSNESN